MSDKDGGSAFPAFRRGDVLTENGYVQQSWPEGGMTLRDYFAAQAVKRCGPVFESQMTQYFIDQAARTAYQLADAMLAERVK